MKHLFFLILIFSNQIFSAFQDGHVQRSVRRSIDRIESFNQDGFLAGTLVKTSIGYVPIEHLKENDLVISYDFKNGSLVEDKICNVHKKEIKNFVQITVNNQDIRVAPNHKFYCPMNEKSSWVQAKNLKVNDFILKNIKELIRVEKVNSIEQESQVYNLSIKDQHNFFVTEQDVFVHNEPCSIVLVTICGVEVTIEAAGLALAGLSWLTHKVFGDNSNKRLSSIEKDYKDYRDIIFAKELGKPAEKDGYEPPRNDNGQKKPHPKTGQYGWVDKKGDYWIPDKSRHGGPHWDVVSKDGKRHKNVVPGGKIRGQ